MDKIQKPDCYFNSNNEKKKNDQPLRSREMENHVLLRFELKLLTDDVAGAANTVVLGSVWFSSLSSKRLQQSIGVRC